MNRRPPHEPSRIFSQPNRLWDNPTLQPRSLGCSTCLEFSRCGGVHTDAGVLDCHDLCSCKDKNTCDMVCRFNPSHFVARMREIGGLSFNAPRVPARGVPDLPLVVPFVDHRYSRTETLDEQVVSLSLYEVVNLVTGRPHVSTVEQLAERFLIPEGATVVLSGVDKDGPIERWWELKNRRETLRDLAALGIGLVTSPNYSVLTDVPRTDNLHAMKRILLAWTEMADAGLCAALHLNGRTEHDYRRWAELIAARPEIEIVAFEFATGCGRGERIDWHVTQLCALADSVGRPLTLVIRGGGRKLRPLRQHFAQVSLIETDAFARTLRRRRAHLVESGRLKWIPSPTPKGAPIHDLLAHNIHVVRSVYETQAEQAPYLRLSSPLARLAAHRDRQTSQTGFLRERELPGEARRIPPEPQGMITTAKPKVRRVMRERAKDPSRPPSSSELVPDGRHIRSEHDRAPE